MRRQWWRRTNIPKGAPETWQALALPSGTQKDLSPGSAPALPVRAAEAAATSAWLRSVSKSVSQSVS